MEKKKNSKQLLTLEERILIEETLKTKMSYAKLSKVVKRSQTCIFNEIHRNGGRENYNALEADKRSQLFVTRRNEKNAIRLQNSHRTWMGLSRKVINLEMQIEILYEEIKRMKDDKN